MTAGENRMTAGENRMTAGENGMEGEVVCRKDGPCNVREDRNLCTRMFGAGRGSSSLNFPWFLKLER